MTSTTNPDTTTLTIRNVDSTLRDQLRVRAAHHGRYMEAELRAILRETLGREQFGEPNLGEPIRRRFASFGGVEFQRNPPVAVGKPLRFKK